MKPPLVHRAVASVCGAGFLPMAPGTWTSILAACAWYGLQPSFERMQFLPWLFLAVITVAGLVSVARVREAWGEDPSQVVIDEWAGMWVACLMLPHRPAVILAALVLFRVFDIFKPMGIRQMERLHGATGVMLDDLLAGVYANLAVHVLLWTELLN